MGFFKVVYIINTKEIEAVPSNWECNGILLWPPNKRMVRKLQQDSNSWPDSSWINYDCEVKEAQIPLFGKASDRADYFCSIQLEEEKNEYKQEPLQSRSCNKDIYPEYIPDILKDKNTGQGLILISSDEVTHSVKEAMGEFFNQMHERFNQIMSNMDTRLNKIEAMFINSDTPSSVSVRVPEISIFPIETPEQLYELEKNLTTNNQYYESLLNYLTKMAGTGQRWRVVAYKLCDFMFSTNLLMNFSWTGASRNNSKKQQFSSLLNVLALFNDIVYNSDPTFTLKMRDSFFKDGVLKHSAERSKNGKRKRYMQEVRSKVQICRNTDIRNTELVTTAEEIQSADHNTYKDSNYGHTESYECSKCYKMFSEKNILTNHLQTHHGKTRLGDKNFDKIARIMPDDPLNNIRYEHKTIKIENIDSMEATSENIYFGKDEVCIEDKSSTTMPFINCFNETVCKEEVIVCE